jgi:hypothetical protein
MDLLPPSAMARLVAFLACVGRVDAACRSWLDERAAALRSRLVPALSDAAPTHHDVTRR